MNNYCLKLRKIHPILSLALLITATFLILKLFNQNQLLKKENYQLSNQPQPTLVPTLIPTLPLPPSYFAKNTQELQRLVENWDNYKATTSQFFADESDCGSEETQDSKRIKSYFSSLPMGSNSTAVFNQLRLLISPNEPNFSLDDLKTNRVVCSVGDLYPLKVFSDKVLWTSACSAGFTSEEIDGQIKECTYTREILFKLYQ